MYATMTTQGLVRPHLKGFVLQAVRSASSRLSTRSEAPEIPAASGQVPGAPMDQEEMQQLLNAEAVCNCIPSPGRCA